MNAAVDMKRWHELMHVSIFLLTSSTGKACKIMYPLYAFALASNLSLAGEIPATAPDPKHAEAERAEVISVEPCFAQDLLVQDLWGMDFNRSGCSGPHRATGAAKQSKTYS